MLMVQKSKFRAVPMVVLLAVRLVLFSLPGILTWLVVQPNLRPKYLPAAAWFCVALAALGIGVGAMLGMIVPRSGWLEGRRARHKTDHRNGDSA